MKQQIDVIEELKKLHPDDPTINQVWQLYLRLDNVTTDELIIYLVNNLIDQLKHTRNQLTKVLENSAMPFSLVDDGEVVYMKRDKRKGE